MRRPSDGVGEQWLRELATALDSAGLPPMTIHDLRHTTASLAISAGANVKAVQKMLGHASAAMTLDIYADLFDDDPNDVAQRLDDAAHHSMVSILCPKPEIETLSET